MEVPMALHKSDPAGKSTGSLPMRQVPRPHGRKVSESTLPGKTSKESARRPYQKPTQVDKENIHRRSRERSLRN
jgi:hypothetical protein